MTIQERTPIALHQTILISPSYLAPLFLLALPKHEVSKGNESLSEIILRLFRSAGPVMTQERWREIWERIKGHYNIHDIIHDIHDIWKELFLFAPRILPFYKLEREIYQLYQSIENAIVPQKFTYFLIEGLLSLPTKFPQVSIFAYKKGIKHILLISPPSFTLMILYWILHLNRKKLEISEEELITWMELTSILTKEKERKVQETIESFLDFEIPFALSKKSDKVKLVEIISQARAIAYVPFASAATQATHLITQGQYIAALEVTLVSGAVTLILVATISLVEALLERIHRK
jgi:hypothetical protein